MKDLFSQESAQYAKYRPSYPEELFTYIDSLPISKERCWDVGTGSGQLAVVLSEIFEHVNASDLSKNQIEQAPTRQNISYSIQSAENPNFPNNHFDLITIGQAIHWFDFDLFYEMVKLKAKRNAMIAVLGYGLVKVSPVIDQVIDQFYTETIGDYWEVERKYVDEQYETIPFPFEEITVPKMISTFNWS